MDALDMDPRLVFFGFLLCLQKPNLPAHLRHLKKYTQRTFFQVHCHYSEMIITLVINYCYGSWCHELCLFPGAVQPHPHQLQDVHP